MAYQIKRTPKSTETLELIDDTGIVIQRIEVDLGADGMAEKVSQKYVDMVAIQQKYQSRTSEGVSERTLEEFGNAVIAIMEAVFGKEDAETILNFYDKKYVEMCAEVMPFITSVVIPKVRVIAKRKSASMRKGLLKRYKRS